LLLAVSKAAYPLKLPASVKAAAARLAKADGVSLNQFIAVAVAEEVGVLETARDVLARRAGKASPRELLEFLRKAGNEAPSEADRRLSASK
jgi:predicted HicB family RNase H-like nuclease